MLDDASRLASSDLHRDPASAPSTFRGIPRLRSPAAARSAFRSPRSERRGAYFELGPTWSRSAAAKRRASCAAPGSTPATIRSPTCSTARRGGRPASTWPRSRSGTGERSISRATTATSRTTSGPSPRRPGGRPTLVSTANVDPRDDERCPLRRGARTERLGQDARGSRRRKSLRGAARPVPQHLSLPPPLPRPAAQRAGEHEPDRVCALRGLAADWHELNGRTPKRRSHRLPRPATWIALLAWSPHSQFRRATPGGSGQSRAGYRCSQARSSSGIPRWRWSGHGCTPDEAGPRRRGTGSRRRSAGRSTGLCRTGAPRFGPG